MEDLIRKIKYSSSFDDDQSSRKLSDDLLIEILLRLPLKSLTRFKCISKSWREVISDPRFQARLPETMSTTAGLFYQKWDTSQLGEVLGYASVSTITTIIPHGDHTNLLNFLPNYPNLRLMDSCNGLLLFLHGSAVPPMPYVYNGSHPPEPDVFFVCNPITRRWVALSECPQVNHWLDCFLVFNPNYSSSLHYFTVIRIGSVISGRLQLSVFHSEKGKWINSFITTPNNRGFLTSRGVVSADGRIVYRVGFPRYLLKINIQEQSCEDIELPENFTGLPCFGLVMYGRSHLIRCALFRGVPSQLQIWDLKEDSREYGKQGWVLKHSNCLEPLIKPRFGWTGMLKTLAFHSDLKVVYLGFSNKIISYSFDDERMEVVHSFARNFDLDGAVKVHPFVPCILNCFDEGEVSPSIDPHN